MASGDNLVFFHPWDARQLTAAYTSVDLITSATSVERFLVLEPFNTNPIAFNGIMSEYYSGGGVTCTIVWTHSANTGTIGWSLGFRTLTLGENLTSSHTYDYNSIAPTVPSQINEVGYDDITFTDGADMDNVGAGDFFSIKIYRDSGSGTTRLLGISIKET